MMMMTAKKIKRIIINYCFYYIFLYMCVSSFFPFFPFFRFFRFFINYSIELLSLYNLLKKRKKRKKGKKGKKGKSLIFYIDSLICKYLSQPIEPHFSFLFCLIKRRKCTLNIYRYTFTK